MKASPILISTLCTLLLGISLLIPGVLCAQVDGLFYPSDEDEAFHSVLSWENNQLLIYGQSRENDFESEDYRLWSLQENGDFIWYSSFGGIHHDICGEMISCENGDFLALGTSWDGVFGRNDFSLTRFNSHMVEIWTKYYGGDHREDATSIAEFSNGDILLAGVTKNSISAANKGLYYMLRLSANGSIIWEKKWGSNSRDIIFDIAIDHNDNIYAAGAYRAMNGYSSFEFTEGNSQAYLCKMEGNGSILWDSIYHHPGNNVFKKLLIDDDNRIIVAGNFQAFSNNYDSYISEIDLNGNILWETTIGNHSYDYVGGLTKYLGNIYLASSSCVDTMTYNSDACLNKLDEFGTLIWSKYYGGEESEYLSDLAVINGNIYAVGKTKSYGNHSFNGYLLNTDLDGNLLSQGEKTHSSIFSIYPNPTNSYVNIALEEKLSCDSIRLSLFDMSGKLLKNFSYNYSNRLVVDLGSLSSGTYLITVNGSCLEPKYGKLIIAR